MKLQLNAKLLKKASGYSRLMQIMTGNVPSIHTFGIISVDNPQNQQITPEQNNERRIKFKEYLRATALYGYVQHSGKYGNFENAFFIINCRRNEVISWGNHYDQESVIFGTVDHTNKKVVFELIYGDTVKAVREVVLQVEEGQEDFYSTCKGRKFQIPFFDDKYAPEKKFTRTEDELIHHESNLSHLATIFAHAEHIKGDALGQTCGMAIFGHRHAVRQALEALED